MEWEISPSLRPIASSALAVAFGLSSLSRQQTNPGTSLLVISIPILAAFYFYNDFSPDDALNEIFARFLLIWLAHMSCLLCLVPSEELQLDRKRFIAHAQKEVSESVEQASHSQHPRSKGQLQSWRYAYKTLFSRRDIGSPWAPDVAHYGPVAMMNDGCQREEHKGARSSKSGSIQRLRLGTCATETQPSRWTFVIRKCSILLCRYITLCVYFDPSVYRNMLDGKPWSSFDFTPEKQIFIRRLICPPTFSIFQFCNNPITSRDFMIRFWLSLDLIVSDYLVLSSIHDILAIIGVSLGLDCSEEWPQLFGSITEAYTVRKFWSRFWHRLIYRSFRAHASLFSSKVLRIRRRSILSRYVNNALVFFLSGLMHTLVEWTHSGRVSECDCWGVTVWYCMQFGAILAEEVMQRTWAMVENRLPLVKEQRKLLQMMRRGVGYLWVMIWIFWSRSKTYYPKALCMMESR